MEKEVNHLREREADISILKLVQYNLLFFMPLLLGLAISLYLGRPVGKYLQVSPSVAVEILMIFFTIIIFFFIIPFIRKRESIKGIRFALLAFLLVGFFFTIPSILAGDYGLLLDLLIYFGSYILLTFIYAPEVLGMVGDITEWFNKHRQLLIILVYVAIVMFYVTGFGVIFHDIANDPNHPNPFIYSHEMEKSYGTFIYYSIITFATVGYGDILPVSPAARLVASFEVVLGMVINVVFIAILFVFISNYQSFYGRKEGKKIEKEQEKLRKEEHDIEKEEEQIEKKEKQIAGAVLPKREGLKKIDEALKRLKK